MSLRNKIKQRAETGTVASTSIIQDIKNKEELTKEILKNINKEKLFKQYDQLREQKINELREMDEKMKQLDYKPYSDYLESQRIINKIIFALDRIITEDGINERILKKIVDTIGNDILLLDHENEKRLKKYVENTISEIEKLEPEKYEEQLNNLRLDFNIKIPKIEDVADTKVKDIDDTKVKDVDDTKTKDVNELPDYDKFVENMGLKYKLKGLQNIATQNLSDFYPSKFRNIRNLVLYLIERKVPGFIESVDFKPKKVEGSGKKLLKKLIKKSVKKSIKKNVKA